MVKMSTNVADMVGEELDALSVQCKRDGERDILNCSVTNTPESKYFVEDWGIEVDELTGRKVTQTSYNESIGMVSIPPAGGTKTCLVQLGNGRGDVELVCSEEESELTHHRRPAGFKEALRERELKYGR